jgi:glycosyltransferase involved in cell wall biosynthesis
LWRAAVAVAPLRTARGLQNKVLEALAAGLPAVVTTQVAQGLPGGVLPGCRVADAAEAFARETMALLHAGPAERRAVAEGADVKSLGWERQLATVRGLLERATRGPGA